MKLPRQDEWINLLEEHLDRRPLMTPRDVYKLLYQGILGPEHLVASPSAFAERLLAEYEMLTPGRHDPLLEAIRPHKSLLRINLKPFKAAGLDLNILVTACLQTSRHAWGTQEELRNLWESFSRSYRKRPMAAFTPGEVDEFTDWLTSMDYPAVHHSQAYSQAYQPAYRLVAAEHSVQLTKLRS